MITDQKHETIYYGCAKFERVCGSYQTANLIRLINTIQQPKALPPDGEIT